jgi:hypothetical protein
VQKFSSEDVVDDRPVGDAMLRPADQNSLLTVPLEPKWPPSFSFTNGCGYAIWGSLSEETLAGERNG